MVNDGLKVRKNSCQIVHFQFFRISSFKIGVLIVPNKIVPTENVPTGVDPKCDFGPIRLAQVSFFHEIQPIFDISIQ